MIVNVKNWTFLFYAVKGLKGNVDIQQANETSLKLL